MSRSRRKTPIVAKHNAQKDSLAELENSTKQLTFVYVKKTR